VGGLNPSHTGSLLGDDLLHGVGRFVGIDAAKFAAVDHQDLVRFFPGFGNPIEQLTLQLMDVFVKPRCREKH